MSLIQGGSLHKRNADDNRFFGVTIGYLVTPFNTYVKKPIKDYNINYKFYVDECNKIINSIKDKQLTLW